MLAALDSVEARLGDEKAGEFERILVESAPGVSLRELEGLCRRVRDGADPDGVQPREEEARARSGARIVPRPDGGARWILDLNPEAQGFLTAAVEARIAPRRDIRFVQAGDDDPSTALALRDPRTVAQRRLDAHVDIARESLKRDDGEVGGVAVAMTVVTTH